MTKKNILFIPSWYPTKTNPIGGSFFQEQSQALLSEFNIFVGYLEFRRLNIVKFLFHLISFRLGSQINAIEVIQPPQAVTFIAYGLNLRHISIFIPPIFMEFVSWINEKLEIRAHSKMYSYIVKNFKFHPDIIYSLTAQINGVPTYYLGKKVKKPVILAEHVPFSIDALPFHKKEKVRESLEKADKLLVVSYDKARQILMGNVNCNPVVVGNLVNENIFTLKPDKSNALPNLLIVASYNFYKDYETFFKSMNYLRSICNMKFTITIIGIAPGKEKNMWAEGEDKFWKEFSKYQLSDITTIIKHVDRDKIVRYYHEADLFILTSIQEGLPVSVLEAMACGVPVFSTRCGGVEDFLIDSCGRVFALRDYKSIAESIKEFLEGRLMFDKTHIRKIVVDKFGNKMFCQRMKNVFNECIENYSEKVK